MDDQPPCTSAEAGRESALLEALRLAARALAQAADDRLSAALRDSEARVGLSLDGAVRAMDEKTKRKEKRDSARLRKLESEASAMKTELLNVKRLEEEVNRVVRGLEKEVEERKSSTIQDMEKRMEETVYKMKEDAWQTIERRLKDAMENRINGMVQDSLKRIEEDTKQRTHAALEEMRKSNKRAREMHFSSGKKNRLEEEPSSIKRKTVTEIFSSSKKRSAQLPLPTPPQTVSSSDQPTSQSRPALDSNDDSAPLPSSAASPRSSAQEDQEALAIAVKNANMVQVRSFLRLIDPIFPDKEGNTLIHVAVMKNRYRVLRELLKTRRFQVDAQNSQGQTALHVAASLPNGVSYVNALLEMKGKVNIADDDGNTALHSAAKGGNEKIVTKLLTAGASPRARNKEGATPRDVAQIVEVRELLRPYERQTTLHSSLVIPSSSSFVSTSEANSEGRGDKYAPIRVD